MKICSFLKQNYAFKLLLKISLRVVVIYTLNKIKTNKEYNIPRVDWKC